MKIYTRTGDSGDTALFDGTRVSKADSRVAAFGEVDELNAWIGLSAAAVPEGDLRGELQQIQRDLFALGSRLADPSHRIAGRVTKAVITPDDVGRLEQWIDRLEEELPPLRRFVLPGGGRGAAELHVARTVCRRAERAIVAISESGLAIELQYINRLSDLLFTMARAVNRRTGAGEVEW